MKKKFIFFIFSSLLFGETLPLFFQGNQQIDERDLYGAINLYKPYFYEFYKDKPAVEPKTAMLLVQTIKDYYRNRGYFNAVVTYKQSEESVYIVINEKLPVLVADVAVISKLDISQKIPFQIGDIFDSGNFTQSKNKIKLLYANMGYCNAVLDAKAWVDIETNRAYVLYDATPSDVCHFGSIEITPSKNIDAGIIKSLLYIEEGEPFSPAEITKSYESLYLYDGISKAIIETVVDTNNSVEASVSVSENEKPIRFQTGLGVSSDEGITASIGVKHRNLFGNLKTLSLLTRVSAIKKTIKTNFDMPLADRDLTGVELGYENEEFIGFKENRTFGTIFLKQREKPNSFKESLFFDNSKSYDSDNTSLYPEGNLFVLSAKLEWGYDVRDKILDPINGYFINAEVIGSILSKVSDATYHKFKLSGGYILPLNSSVLALRASFGSLQLHEGNIPKSYLFYAGGMYSNRAYGYRKLSPKTDAGEPIGSNSIFETKIEYRFPIYGDFRGVVFNDNTYIGENGSPDYDNGHYTAGFGLRYVTPIGPIAIDIGCDIANPTTQYAIHFHIGELF